MNQMNIITNPTLPNNNHKEEEETNCIRCGEPIVKEELLYSPAYNVYCHVKLCHHKDCTNNPCICGNIIISLEADILQGGEEH